MFFKVMPKISYKTNGETINTKDIFQRVGLDRKLTSRASLEAYYVKNGETPDIIANNLYGSSNYHWIILTVNDIVNTNEEWPKRQEEIFAYAESKYGVGNSGKDNHYRLTSDITVKVDYNAVGIANGSIEAVSNIDYEVDQNEKKRQIFILRTEFLSSFITQYKSLMDQ
jgi:hypothetical protein